MGTAITLNASGVQLSGTHAAPGANLNDTIRRLASASSVTQLDFKPIEVTNPDGDVLNVTDTRCVGTGPLSVEMVVAPAASTPLDKVQGPPASVQQVHRQVQRLEAMLQLLTTEFRMFEGVFLVEARGKLIACAGQILEKASMQPLEAERGEPAQRDDPAVVGLAAMAGQDAGEFAHEINGMLGRGGHTAASCKDLDEKVDFIKTVMTPRLREGLEGECWLIEQYDEIKDAFPERFGMTPLAAA